MGIEEFVLWRERRLGFIEGQKRAKKRYERERDTFYVKSLLGKTDLSNDKIMDITNVTLDFVEKVRKKINK
jgi:hypothetical protein